MNKKMTRRELLDQLSLVRIQLDQLHKYAFGRIPDDGGEPIELLTEEEYWALNDALNYYGAVVGYLHTHELFGLESPEGYPQSLAEQVAISRRILTQ